MRSVLLLNASFEPIRIVSIQRAVQLMYEDEVDVIETGEGLLRSPSVTYEVPTVLRLKRYRKIPHRVMVPLTNRGVLQRDNFTCAYCGKNAKTVDHVHPRSKGGQHRWENVIASCYKCNNKKSNMTLEQMGWELPYAPFVPTAKNWLSIGPNIHEHWKPYLAATNK